jgi:hypothetical protein
MLTFTRYDDALHWSFRFPLTPWRTMAWDPSFDYDHKAVPGTKVPYRLYFFFTWKRTPMIAVRGHEIRVRIGTQYMAV